MILNQVKSGMTLLICTLLATGCASDPSVPLNKEKPVTVTIATPAGATSDYVTCHGQIEAAHAAMVSTRMMGYITSIPVKVGDRVKQGQLLFTVSSTDLVARRSQTESSIASAEAAYQQAEKDYERYKTLYQKQSASARELENMELQFKAAKAQFAAAKQMRNEVNAQLSFTNVTAPFSGVITQKMMNAGDLASPGMPILALEGDGQLQVTASVQEADIASISRISPVTITVGAAGKTVQGTLTEIGSSSKTSGGQYPIKIAIPAAEQNGLYSGMYAQVSIQTAKRSTTVSNSVLVPAESIVRKNELTGIYTPGNGNTALLRWVRLGKTSGTQVEVLSGLASNEQFILHADGKLYNGAAITTRNVASR